VQEVALDEVQDQHARFFLSVVSVDAATLFADLFVR
jgi:hypothetical protein